MGNRSIIFIKQPQLRSHQSIPALIYFARPRYQVRSVANINEKSYYDDNSQGWSDALADVLFRTEEDSYRGEFVNDLT